MARRNTIFVTLSLLVAAAAAPHATAQPRTVEAEGSYIHQPTGMAFPLTAGSFQRLRMIEYSGDGKDVSAHYRTGQAPDTIEVVVYISPALSIVASDNAQPSRERLCNEEFALVSAEVGRHPGARLLEKGSLPSPSAYYSRNGLKAVFALDSMGERHGPLRSEADLFCHVGNKWSFKYRTTAGASVPYEKALARLMHDLAWPMFPQFDVATLITPLSPIGLTPASALHP